VGIKNYRLFFNVFLILISFFIVLVAIYGFVMPDNLATTKSLVAKTYDNINVILTNQSKAIVGQRIVGPYSRDLFNSRSGNYDLFFVDHTTCVLSVGPDGINGHAETMYDPTNGEFSVGDIWKCSTSK